MAINRFYKPSASNYQSQFVPEKIPFDAMAMALVSKQKAEDAAVENTNKLGLWDNPALPGMDTYYRDQYKKGIEGFIDESFGVEQSSPEFQRKYINKVREIRDNPELKKITSNYNTHQAYLKTIEDYKKDPNTYSYAAELEHKYKQKYNNYTRPVEAGGMGYKGDIGLGDPNILRGTDINKEGEEIFNHIKDSGSESLGFLEEGLAYKNGWSGVGKETIDAQTIRMLDQWISSPAGKQLGERWDMRNFPNEMPDVAISKMTPEQQTEYLNKRNTYIGNELLNIGRGFQHDQFTTNADVAYRDRWGVGQERMNLYPTPQITNFAGDATPFARDYDKDIQEQQLIAKTIDEKQWGIDNYEKAKADPNASPQFSKLAEKSQETINAWKAEVYALKQEQKAFKTREANAIKVAYTATDPNIDPKYVDEFGEFKLKHVPYGGKGSYISQELTGLHDHFTQVYNQILKSKPMINYKVTGTNIAGQATSWQGELSNVAELAKTYNDGIKEIEKLKKVKNLSEDDKKNLEFFEQKFRINSAHIFSKIPEMPTEVTQSWSQYFSTDIGANTTIIRNPYLARETFEKAKRENYADVGSWTPNAQNRDPDHIVLMDEKGTVGKPVESADFMAEKFVGLYPQQNIIMLGNEVIDPKDPRYPKANGKAKVVSSTVDKIGNDGTPVLQVNYEYDKKGINPFDKGEVGSQTYTVIMKGANALQYNQMKARQLQSDMWKNPNDVQNSIRYINMKKFQDPKLSTDLTELSKLKPGETYTTEIGSLENYTNHSIDIQRSSIDDSWNITVIDPETGKKDVTNLPHAMDATNYFLFLHENNK